MLFQILSGDSSRIGTDITPLHEGYVYFTPDDGGLYIDAEKDGTVERIQINPKNDVSYAAGEEQVIGTWIDGRPIWRKTFTWSTDPLPSSKWSYYRESDLVACNIGQYVNIYGMALCKSTSTTMTGTWQPLPRICPDALSAYSIGFGDLTDSCISVLFGSSYTSATLYVTIEYVKKT